MDDEKSAYPPAGHLDKHSEKDFMVPSVANAVSGQICDLRFGIPDFMVPLLVNHISGQIRDPRSQIRDFMAPFLINHISGQIRDPRFQIRDFMYPSIANSHSAPNAKRLTPNAPLRRNTVSPMNSKSAIGNRKSKIQTIGNRKSKIFPRPSPHRLQNELYYGTR